jgi:hypothetical protein
MWETLKEYVRKYLNVREFVEHPFTGTRFGYVLWLVIGVSFFVWLHLHGYSILGSP